MNIAHTPGRAIYVRSHRPLERPGLPTLGMVSQVGMSVMAVSETGPWHLWPKPKGDWMCARRKNEKLMNEEFCCEARSGACTWRR